ncbi:unnamed protein product [Chironomus riparius]|uniref:Uncharacterized protein n=1 Tax=Chironomus riparius TaxID=315576 RepID=A0A9N9WQN9_9DIPT|nr:unnamed protein product [Chironomus riparius]
MDRDKNRQARARRLKKQKARKNSKTLCMPPTASTTDTKARTIQNAVKKEPKVEVNVSNVLERTFSSPI